jgi:hypothetical protein
MRLPTYLVIGGMKCGSSSLHEYLRSHPDVFASRPKELQFFVGGEVGARGLEWYATHFESAGDAIAVGEASPQYTFAPWFDGVPERIAAALPDVRLVYLVRDPVARMRSHWLHQVRNGRERRSLEEYLIHDAQSQNMSRYAYQAGRYLNCFAREQLLIVESERLRTDTEAALAEVARHLGVDPARFPDRLPREANRSDDKPRSVRPWAHELRARSAATRAIERRLPGPVGRAWTRVSTVPTPVAPPVPAELDRQLRELFAADLAELAVLMGDAAPAWTAV